jgi:hypothetical protein
MPILFFSYSHKDEHLRNELEVHLSMLKREGLIDSWHDRKIPAGDEFDKTINGKLEEAAVILLLVSPDFLASPYCYDKEIATAMQRHERGSARVIPVILRPCDWKNAPFGKLLVAPTDGKPITKWPDRDEAFLDVVQHIRDGLTAVDGGYRRKESRIPALTTQPTTAVVKPRSSNLRVRQHFTDADKDRFLDDAFEFMALLFENSLKELQDRNPGIEGRFKRIDARSFTAVIYKDGREMSRCAIKHGSSAGFDRGITYSTDERAMTHSFSERLTVEEDEQSLFLKPAGMRMWALGGQKQRDHLTFEGAGEYYWEMLMEPLQQ